MNDLQFDGEFARPGITPEPGVSEDTLAASNPQGETQRSSWLLPGVDALDAGERLGRYIVIRRLGAGSMGVVYAAYDPKLDRKVALKLLARIEAEGTELARERLRREALSLAKLAHPNVVGVYDVDVHEGRLYVAMEFISGQTLDVWMRPEGASTSKPWPVVLDKFIEAGRGLAAAHAAGLIHRDFKPENVMVGDDDRVRVMDFGIARPTDAQPKSQPLRASLTLEEGSPELDTPMTNTGSVMGTPAYMAFEQFDGLADARSDQFSFCVALYAGLYGERPFVSDSLPALIAALSVCDVEPPPRGTTVPAWLRAVVLRGLATKPSERWSSMDALLDALANNPAVRRRRWAGAALVVALVAGTAGATAWTVERQAQTCMGFEEKLVGIWDDSTKSRAEAAFERTGLIYAADSFRGASERLDDYTRRWVEARRQSCEATLRGEQSGELLDLRMACLDERLQHVAAAATLLEAPDADIVREAVQVVDLPQLERCADIEALTAERPPPEDPTVAARVEALDEQIIEIKALERAGKYERGLEVAAAVATEAEALGYEPLQARAWLIQGIHQHHTGAYEEAEATLERAYAQALGLKLLPEAAEAAMYLMFVVGCRLARYEDGRRWAKHAEPLVRADGTLEAEAVYFSNFGAVANAERKYDDARTHYERALVLFEQTDGPDHPRLVFVLSNLGVVANAEGKNDDARAYHERALTTLEQALGPDHPRLGTVLTNLGTVAVDEGKFDEARAYYERALAVLERALGPDHVGISSTLTLLGVLARTEGKFDEARAHQERALAIRERTLGPDHPELAGTLSSLGLVAQEQGKLGDARAYQERALAIFDKAVGPDHQSSAAVLLNLGRVVQAEDKLDEARRYYERALAIFDKTVGPDHPYFAITLKNLGTVLEAEGKFDEARASYERALAIRERALGPDHPNLAHPLTALGGALLELDEPAEALGYLERALLLRSSHDSDPVKLALTRFFLARALWDVPKDEGRDRSRAGELAELAAASYEAAGDKAADRLTDVRAWQATREQ